MATPNRKVLDISHWNTVTSWSSVKSAGIRGIIHKATEGTSYIDPNYDGAKAACASNGLLFGAYHFATAQNAAQQLDHFLRKTGEHDDMLYALDWEDYGSNTMGLSGARQFMELLDARLGTNRCVLYSGNTAKEYINGADPFFGAHRLWLAQYGSSPECQQSWSTYWLWQYSDGQAGPSPHGCPGVSGDVDTNSWPSTDEVLAAEWSGLEHEVPPGPDPTPPGDTATVSIDIASTGAVNVFVNGLLVSGVQPVPPDPPCQSRRVATPML